VSEKDLLREMRLVLDNPNNSGTYVRETLRLWLESDDAQTRALGRQLAKEYYPSLVLPL
jgi:hypothetical protein